MDKGANMTLYREGSLTLDLCYFWSWDPNTKVPYLPTQLQFKRPKKWRTAEPGTRHFFMKFLEGLDCDGDPRHGNLGWNISSAHLDG